MFLFDTGRLSDRSLAKIPLTVVKMHNIGTLYHVWLAELTLHLYG